MKPIMLVLASAMAFVVALPSGVWAQIEDTEYYAAEIEALAERAIMLARQNNIDAARDVTQEARQAYKYARRVASNTRDSDERERAYAIVESANRHITRAGRAIQAAERVRYENLLAEAEAIVARGEAAAERAIAAINEGDMQAAEAAAKEATQAFLDVKRYNRYGFYSSYGLRAREAANAISDARLKAYEDRRRAEENERRAAQAEAAREAQAESVGLEEAARLVGERVREDYGVIFGIYENAELAVALAERALEAAESEEDYAEAWKRHRGAAQYRDGVNDIVVRAERLANASVSSVNEAINYLSQAKDEDDNLRIHNLTELAKMSVGNAAESAVEVKNLRAQLEE